MWMHNNIYNRTWFEKNSSPLVTTPLSLSTPPSLSPPSLSAGMRTLDLSYNRFPSIPVEIGNMELLKILHEWEVGIGLFQLLHELSVSHCRLTEWPVHIDKIPKLEMINFSGNEIESIPKVIGVHTTLKYLDLSENKLLVFPVDFYSLTQLHVGKQVHIFRLRPTLHYAAIVCVLGCRL
jgi:Leucine-rich repeat (LRR) protein